ncbi:hypothetical protein FKM82_026925 [Ascaphus truei]|uniref:transmembrane protein 119 n=1 Tax=Ascaphus truei TaxID=8439 RepID=UPI003F5AA8CE
MGFPVTLCVFLVFTTPLCLARYTPSETEDRTGSGDGEVPAVSPTESRELIRLTTEGLGAYPNGTSTSLNILNNIVQFLKEYMLLIIVVGSLVFLVMFIVCTAVIMSHKHKASAYYPSSFSQKEYVNHDDMSGGAKAFNEIPEKAQDAKAEEVVDSTKQLQVDILNAAQNLKSPTKATSPKEDPKIPEETKGTQEGTVKDMEVAPSGKTQEESPSEKIEESECGQAGEPGPSGGAEEAPDVQKTTQEETNACVEEINPAPCDSPPTNDLSPPEGQELQPSEAGGV